MTVVQATFGMLGEQVLVVPAREGTAAHLVDEAHVLFVDRVLGLDAPKDVAVHREEIFQRIKNDGDSSESE